MLTIQLLMQNCLNWFLSGFGFDLLSCDMENKISHFISHFEMSLAFKPLQVGPMTLANRFMRSATCEAMADPDGVPNKKLLKNMVKLSEGECGLIIPGFVYPVTTGKAHFKQTGLYNDELAEKWRESIEAIHKNGSKIVFQVAHGGIATVGNLEKIGPSNFRGKQMTIPEIETLIDQFTEAAVRAKKVGADGVQLHGAHGYLLSLFLSPVMNHRKDKYGGSIENRTRIIAEMAESIRSATGKDFAIGIKMNGYDWLPCGVNKKMAAEYVHLLKRKLDFFEISCGIGIPNAVIRKRPTGLSGFLNKLFSPMKFKEGYNLDYAEYIKTKNPDAVIASVGGFRSIKAIDNALSQGKCDLISISRPFIRDPLLVKRFKNQEITEVACKSCNDCFSSIGNNSRGLSCSYP